MALKFGVLGPGRIAERFAHDVQWVDGVELVAVAARDYQRANSFAQRHHIDQAYGDYASLYEDTRVDAIYVATPHNCHAEQSGTALRSGKAVLCEKPVCISPGQTADLIALAHQKQRLLMEGMWTWFLPAVQVAHQWVASGRIGELRQIRADFGYPIVYDPKGRHWSPALAGGCLLDMGIYPIAIARYFLAGDASAVTAQAQFAPNGVESDVTMLLDYGCVDVVLATSFSCRLPNAAHIIGAEASIEIPFFWRANECLLRVNDRLVDQFVDDRRGSGFEYQIAHFRDLLLEGQLESPVVSHAQSMAFQRDIQRVRELLPSPGR